MQCLLKTFSNTKRNVCGYTDHALKRRSIRTKPERSNLIKVAVVGSGSFGEPASLIIKTRDNFMCVSHIHGIIYRCIDPMAKVI